MNTSGTITGLLAVAVLVCGLNACAVRGTATRKVTLSAAAEAAVGRPQATDPGEDVPLHNRWYIESAPVVGGKPHSCSFIEFDDRGDHLDFLQHQQAYKKIRDLAERDRIAVILFVHGWRNNSQSNNVAGFNSFLHQLAETPYVKAQGLRVHGVYLAWRGGIFKHAPVSNEGTGFEAPVAGGKYASRVPVLTNLMETLAYGPDKSLPEHKISGTAVSRSIFTCAHVAKRHGQGKNNRVFLMGHSFGALLLERTFMNATIGELAEEWAWSRPDGGTDANPLPFDTIMFVNSAAPSIYAKQFKGFLAAHHNAMEKNRIKGADAPIFISLTSDGDSATGKMHALGNSLAGLSPTLQRNYDGYDFILRKREGSPAPAVPQSEYYRMTPGHNPLLVNRWIEEDGESDAGQRDILDANLERKGVRGDAARSFLTREGTSGPAQKWRIATSPGTDNNKKWSAWRGFEPLCRENEHSPYWIVRCPAAIIKNHGDIWNQRAMQTYAALFRVSDVMRRE